MWSKNVHLCMAERLSSVSEINTFQLKRTPVILCGLFFFFWLWMWRKSKQTLQGSKICAVVWKHVTVCGKTVSLTSSRPSVSLCTDALDTKKKKIITKYLHSHEFLSRELKIPANITKQLVDEAFAADILLWLWSWGETVIILEKRITLQI